MEFDSQTAWRQIHDLFQLMLVKAEADEVPGCNSHVPALKRAIALTAAAVKKAGGTSSRLPEIIQIEKTLSQDLEAYPVTGLTDKILDNIKKYKSFL